MIPSMHPTGLDPVLRRYAHGVGPYSAIVEVGSWCGASAYQLAKGSGALTDIHLYDRWHLSMPEVMKLRSFGIDRPIGYDLQPMAAEYLSEFGERIKYHKGDIRSANYYGRWDIGLYVDDASKNLIGEVFPRFEPRLKPGCVLIFMDYHHPSCDKLRDYVKSKNLHFLEDVDGASVWRYE